MIKDVILRCVFNSIPWWKKALMKLLKGKRCFVSITHVKRPWGSLVTSLWPRSACPHPHPSSLTGCQRRAQGKSRTSRQKFVSYLHVILNCQVIGKCGSIFAWQRSTKKSTSAGQSPASSKSRPASTSGSCCSGTRTTPSSGQSWRRSATTTNDPHVSPFVKYPLS